MTVRGYKDGICLIHRKQNLKGKLNKVDDDLFYLSWKVTSEHTSVKVKTKPYSSEIIKKRWKLIRKSKK